MVTDTQQSIRHYHVSEIRAMPISEQLKLIPRFQIGASGQAVDVTELAFERCMGYKCATAMMISGLLRSRWNRPTPKQYRR